MHRSSAPGLRCDDAPKSLRLWVGCRALLRDRCSAPDESCYARQAPSRDSTHTTSMRLRLPSSERPVSMVVAPLAFALELEHSPRLSEASDSVASRGRQPRARNRVTRMSRHSQCAPTEHHAVDRLRLPAAIRRRNDGPRALARTVSSARAEAAPPRCRARRASMRGRLASQRLRFGEIGLAVGANPTSPRRHRERAHRPPSKLHCELLNTSPGKGVAAAQRAVDRTPTRCAEPSSPRGFRGRSGEPWRSRVRPTASPHFRKLSERPTRSSKGLPWHGLRPPDPSCPQFGRPLKMMMILSLGMVGDNPSSPSLASTPSISCNLPS
jgi:hypothetical protein